MRDAPNFPSKTEIRSKHPIVFGESSTTLRLLLAVATVFLAWGTTLAPRDALAAGIDSNDPVKAEELIRQANDLRRNGHDERALPLLRQAYEVARSARTAGQLGLAEMALGYWAPAEGHLDESLTESRNPWVDRNRPTLENALRTAQSHIADLRVEGKPDGAEVLVNRRVVGTLPFASPLRLNEGRISVEVRAAGWRSMSTTLTLAGHGSERLQVALERDENKETKPAAAATTVVPSASAGAKGGVGAASTGPADAAVGTGSAVDDHSSHSSSGDGELPTWRRVLPWTLLGGAVLSGAFGVWQQIGSQSAQSSFDAIAACGAGLPMRGSDSRCLGYYDDFSGSRTRAYVGYGIAGVLGAGAATIFIVNAISAPTGSASAGDGGGQASVGVGPHGAMVSYAARFP